MSQNIENFQAVLRELTLESNISMEHEIQDISYNSSQVKPQTLFICKGTGFQEKYLLDAQEKGAVCYISEKKFNINMDYILVSDLRTALGLVVEQHFGKLSEKINILGITGTKGKTTTAMLLRSIIDSSLKAENKPLSALLCSILTYDGVAEEPSRLTTKEPIELYRHIQNAINSNITTLCMEVSSQAVKYQRIFGLGFTMGCYLNIGEDHISPQEHPDFEDYFQSKLLFFQSCQAVTVHLDGIHTQRVLDAVPPTSEILTCSRKDENADFYIKSVEKKGTSSYFSTKTPRGVENYRLDMAGLFNLDNALCAIAMAHHLGIPQEHIAEGLLTGGAPGRMELYRSQDEKLTILVDYAHNEMSFQAIFSSMKSEFPQKKLVAVFGCPGDKALERRKDMGQIADAYADFSFLTEDDCGYEDVEAICQEIASHMPKKNLEIQANREQAVELACNLYPNEEKIVLLLGKGPETDQKRGSLYVKNPSDAELAQTFLKAYDLLNPSKSDTDS